MAENKRKANHNPKSNANLKTFKEMGYTTEDFREFGRRGAIAANKVKREKKQARECIEFILNLPMKDGEIDENFKSIADAKKKNLTTMDLLIIEQVKKAKKGDTKAFEMLLNRLEGTPVARQETKVTVDTSPLQGILDQLKDDNDDENDEN